MNKVVLGMFIGYLLSILIEFAAFKWPSDFTVERCKEISKAYPQKKNDK